MVGQFGVALSLVLTEKQVGTLGSWSGRHQNRITSKFFGTIVINKMGWLANPSLFCGLVAASVI